MVSHQKYSNNRKCVIFLDLQFSYTGDFVKNMGKGENKKKGKYYIDRDP